MKKIRLDPETLAVQSFVTMGLPRGRGTVRGADAAPAPTRPDMNCEWTYQGCETELCVYSPICVYPEISVDTCHDTCAGMPGC
jgi:hypothetical protein